MIAHPENWKAHPDRQVAAIAGAIEEVGFLGEILVSARSGRILDGHARVAEAVRTNQLVVPVGYIECADDAEELRILATYDPIGGLALLDASKLGEVARQAQIANDALTQMLSGLVGTSTKPPEEQSAGGRQIGNAYGPQGGPAPGGHLGALPAEIWPVVVECKGADEQDELQARLEEEGYATYVMDPAPRSLGKDAS